MKHITGDWNETRERPKGRVEKAASLQQGTGSEKTYFAANGVFRRIMRLEQVYENPEFKFRPFVYWMKLDKCSIRSDGSFMK